MSEQAVRQFLRDDERELLDADRTRVITMALCNYAEMLLEMSMAADEIRPKVDQMRDHLSTLPSEKIRKVSKHLLHTATLLAEATHDEKRPQLAAVNELEEPAPIIPPVPEPEQTVIEKEVHTGGLLSETQESAEDSGDEAVEPAAQSAGPAEEEPEIDERKPKNVPDTLNDAFGKSFTYGQRAAFLELNDEQQAQFTQLFLDLAQTNGDVNMQRRAKRYAEMIGYMFKGLSNSEIGELVGVTSSNIPRSFRTTLPSFIHENKRAFVQGYMEILASTPELLERTAALQKPSLEAEAEEQKEAQKSKREKVIHPEGVPDNIDNALKQLLNFEQRAAIAEFSETQQEGLVLLVDRILAKNESIQDNLKDKWVGRFERLLGGMAVREVANLEGIEHPLAIIQGFSKVLPRLLAKDRDEFIARFEEIRAENFEVEQETEPTTEAGTAEIEQEQSEDLPSEATEVTDDLASEDEPTVEITIKPEALAVEEPVVAKPEQQETEQAPVEPLVELMQKAFSNEDPIALQAISDLFTVQKQTQTSEETTEAARYLSAMIRKKGINLSISLEGNTKAKVIVENMLDGKMTLSEALMMTPEVFRGNKMRAIEAAFKKIAGMLEGERSVPSDAKELQIANLRSELHKYIGVSPELTSKVIDRAIEKNDEYSSELGRALLFLNREAVGVGPDEMQLRIIRLFTTPQPGGAPLSVAEIRTTLAQEQAAARNGSSKQYDNGYVTAMLLRLFDKIVTQRKDG